MPPRSTTQPDPHEGSAVERLLDEDVKFQQGVHRFRLLFVRWMDLNAWSHPVMTNLAKSALGGASWLHSSQISGFRHAKLLSPGPRAFIAIERLNYYLHRYKTEKKLIPNTASSNFYADPFVITENGEPPGVGWWVEVFCGVRIPADINFNEAAFTAEQAESLSHSWGRLIRKLLTLNGYDLIADLESAVRKRYPAGDEDRIEKHLCVIRMKDVWTPDELANELPALASMAMSLGGPMSEEALITELRKK